MTGAAMMTASISMMTAAHDVAVGTIVLTMDGAIPVEFLTPGDRIITRNGAQTLRGAKARTVADCTMIRVCGDEMDDGQADVMLTPDQPILIRDWRARAITGNTQAMIAAGRLVDGAYMRRETVVAQRVVRLEFDAPVVIYAGNLELVVPAAIAA
jgi:hypothetical protein